MAKTVVAVEITEDSVRAAEVSVGRVPQLLAAGEVPLPPDAAKDSEVLDPGAVSVAIRQLWTSAGIKGRVVTLGVASRRILVREYTTQATRPDILRQALPFQVQDLLPVPVAQAVLDFYPTSQDGDQVNGLLVAAVSETIEQIIATFARAKLRVDAVDLTAFGLARLAGRLGSAGETLAIVHLGDHTTQVVVTRDGVPQFVRIIPVDLPTLASRRGAPVAEQMLERELVPTTRARGAARPPTGDPVVSDLVARVRSTLAFYANRTGSDPLRGVYLSGAGAMVAGVASAMSDGLDAPVQTIDVNSIISVKSAFPPSEFALNLVSTVGLALEGGGR